MFRLKSSLLLILSALSGAAIGGDEPYKIPIPDGVPEGFENITQTGSYYDVFINGAYHSTLTRDVPIDGLSPSLLSKEIVTHLDAPQWQETRQQYLSNSESTVAAFESKHRIDVFIPKKDVVVSGAGFSWQANIRTNQFLNMEGGGAVGGTQLDGIASLDDKALKVNAYHYDGELAFTTASVTQEWGDSRVSYGLFSPSYGRYSRLYDRSIVGVQYHANAILSESSSNRPDINLVLTDTAIVIVSRNKTPLKTLTLGAGEQTIPVHDLPPGHYDVTLQIQYFNGQTETQYASVDAPVRDGASLGWQGFSVGRLYRNGYFGESYDQQNELFVSTAYTARLSDGLLGDISLNYQQGLNINPTLSYKAGGLSSRLSVVIGEESDAFWDTLYRKGDHSFSARYQYSEARESWDETDIENPENVQLAYLAYSTDELDGFLDTNRVSLTYRYDNDKYGSFYTGLQYDIERNQKLATAMHVIPIYRNRNHNLQLRTTLRSGDETHFGINLTYRLSPPKSDYRMFSSLDVSDSVYFRQTAYQQKQYKNWRVNNRLGLSTGRNTSSAFLNSNFDNNNYGNGSVGITHIDNGSSQNTYVNALASVKFAGDAESFHVVGRETAQTGMVVDLSKQKHDEKYTMEVNGKMSTYQGGESHFIPLAPHQEYSVSLLNKDSRDNRVEQSNKNFYLHRYNVYTPHWEFKKIELLYGTLVVNGEVMPGAHLRNGISQGFSDKAGRFFIEAYDNSVFVNGTPCLIVDKTEQDIHVSCSHDQKNEEIQ